MKPPWTRNSQKDPVKKRFKKNVSDKLRETWDVDNVVELDEHRKIWLNFEALCTTCLHKWVAVAITTTGLECPECGHMTGGKIEKEENEHDK